MLTWGLRKSRSARALRGSRFGVHTELPIVCVQRIRLEVHTELQVVCVQRSRLDVDTELPIVCDSQVVSMYIQNCQLFVYVGALLGPDLRVAQNPHYYYYYVSLKTLLQQGISELVYRFKKIVGKSNFSEQFRKLINRYKRIGYSLDIMRQTACLVVNPIIVDGYFSLFNCTTAVWASDSMTASS